MLGVYPGFRNGTLILFDLSLSSTHFDPLLSYSIFAPSLSSNKNRPTTGSLTFFRRKSPLFFPLWPSSPLLYHVFIIDIICIWYNLFNYWQKLTIPTIMLSEIPLSQYRGWPQRAVNWDWQHRLAHQSCIEHNRQDLLGDNVTAKLGQQFAFQPFSSSSNSAQVKLVH